MTGHQNRLSRFWQELKRRRVIHVIAVYASAAFVIIELAGNLTEPLNMPTSLSTIVIIVLAVGFPLAIVLSWLYDLTSGTFERTKPMEDFPEGEKAKVPNAWKIATYVSFVVIVGLAALNIVSRGDIIKPGMIQSLAILPFDNYTGDENLDYVAAGMHSSLIGDMGKLGALRVIGKTSSSVYKNTDKSAPAIAKELNVDALLEPTLTCYGDTVCIQIRVVTPYPEEKQLWVEDYREDKSKILSLYNRVTKEIAEQLKVKLTAEEKGLLAKSRLIDKEAYDVFLQSQMYWNDLGKETLEKAIDYLNIAIDKDPDWAPPYSGLAFVWGSMTTAGYVTPDISEPKISEYIQRAMELDPDLLDLHFTLGTAAVWTEWNWEKGEKEFLQALAINPNDAMSRMYYAHLLMIMQRDNEALSQAQRAVDLEPLSPLIHAVHAVLLGGTGYFEAAVQELDRALEIDPGFYLAWNLMDVMASRCNKYDKAMEGVLLGMPLEIEVKKNIRQVYEEQGFKPAYKLAMQQFEALAREGSFAPFDMAIRYIIIEQYEKALEWLEAGYEIHDHNLPYITTDVIMVDEISKYQRFIEIAEKMNLLLPAAN